MKHSFACLLLLGVLVLVGCSTPTGPGAIKATAALPTPTQTLALPTPSPLAVNLTPLAMRDAWGDVSVKEFSLDIFDRKLMRQVQIDNAPGAGGFAGTVCSHFLVSEAPLTAADHAAAVEGLPYHHVLRVIDTNTLP